MSVMIGLLKYMRKTVSPVSAAFTIFEVFVHVFCPGEDVYISLYGACEEVNVHLEPDFILLRKTYISLSTVHTVSLTNRSDVPLQYCWTTWPSLQDEALSFLRYACKKKLFMTSYARIWF